MRGRRAVVEPLDPAIDETASAEPAIVEFMDAVDPAPASSGAQAVASVPSADARDTMERAVAARGQERVEPPIPAGYSAGGDEEAAVYDGPAPRTFETDASRGTAPSGFAGGIHWKRTLAAAVALTLVAGAAFGMAFWFTRPTDVGTLVVQSMPSGLEVLIDGREAGRTPVTREMRPGRHTIEIRNAGSTKSLDVEVAAGAQTTEYVPWREPALGTLQLTSVPTGARVLVGGRDYGTTPATIPDLPAGSHTVTIEHPSGSVTTRFEVQARRTLTVEIPIFSGWVKVFAPVELEVQFEGRRLGTTLEERFMLPAGRHRLDLISDPLGYRAQEVVTIEPGAVTPLSVQVPNGTLAIEADPGTEVWVDGERKGTAPLPAMAVPIGTREVVLRHPDQGERQRVVIVTLKSASVAAFAP